MKNGKDDQQTDDELILLSKSIVMDCHKGYFSLDRISVGCWVRTQGCCFSVTEKNVLVVYDLFLHDLLPEIGMGGFLFEQKSRQ
jgi:hypothetical protein